jgi:hypothetical protein
MQERIHGISLLNGSKMINNHFVDDSLLLVYWIKIQCKLLWGVWILYVALLELWSVIKKQIFGWLGLMILQVGFLSMELGQT